MQRLAHVRCAVILAALLLAFGLTNAGGASPGQPPSPPTATHVDSDGDGIPDELDPDDNNDGVADGQPGEPEAPDSSGDDADQDTIPDSHDPDDNNNGITDDDEATSNTTPGNGDNSPDTNSPGTDGSSGVNDTGNTNNAGADSPMLVRSLPVTGSGATAVTDAAGIPSAALAAFVAAASCLLLLWKRLGRPTA